jgi:hypothetical protein
MSPTISSIEMTPCLVCHEEIRAFAKKCTKCDSFQDWRRQIPFTDSVLSLLIALISVIGLVAPRIAAFFHRHSETSLRIVSMDDQQQLLIGVSNTGAEAATIRSLRMFFQDVQLKETALLAEQDPAELDVPKDSHHILHVTPEGFEVLSGMQLDCQTWRQIKADLPRATITIVADVYESGDGPNAPTRRTATTTGNQLTKWFDEYLPPPGKNC